MPPGQRTGSTGDTAVILERIEGQLNNVSSDICDLKGLMAEFGTWRREQERSTAVAHIELAANTQRAHERLDRLEPQVRTLTDTVNGLVVQIASMNQKLVLIVAILAFIGAAIGGWIVNQWLQGLTP